MLLIRDWSIDPSLGYWLRLKLVLPFSRFLIKFFVNNVLYSSKARTCSLEPNTKHSNNKRKTLFMVPFFALFFLYFSLYWIFSWFWKTDSSRISVDCFFSFVLIKTCSLWSCIKWSLCLNNCKCFSSVLSFVSIVATSFFCLMCLWTTDQNHQEIV